MSLFPKVGRKQPSVRLSWGLVLTFLWIGVILHLIPFYFMLTLSVKPVSEIMQSPPTLFPQNFTLSAWQLAFTVFEPGANLLAEPLGVYFRNSVIMVGLTLAFSLPITAFAAYANSKLQKGRGARYFFLFFIGTLMVPGAVTLIPSFLLTRNFPFPLPNAPLIPGTDDPFPVLRTWNTAWAFVLPGVFNAFNFLLFKGFFDTIPDSVLQAARVDGGTEFNILRRIVLPMSVPVFAVAFYLQFAGAWDSFLWPLVIFQSSENLPMSVALYNLINRFQQAGLNNQQAAIGANIALRQLQDAGLSWNGLMVLGLLQTVPIFIMFIVCREYLLKGVRLRGLK